MDSTPGMQPVRRPRAGAQVRAEITEKRSRFITLLQRVTTTDEARDLLAHARAEFPDARHHCSAWVISQPGAQPLMHSSDDGEPAGTAGRPMLDVLEGAGLTDVAAVVVRYFGGTLLGTGGLVRAYSEAVQAALEHTPLVTPVELQVLQVSLPHATAARFEADVRSARHLTGGVRDVEYDAAGATLRIATDTPDAIRTLLAELTAGEVSARTVDTLTVDRPAH